MTPDDRDLLAKRLRKELAAVYVNSTLERISSGIPGRVSVNTVRNLLTGVVVPTERTLRAIEKYLSNRGQPSDDATHGVALAMIDDLQTRLDYWRAELAREMGDGG